MFYCKVPIEVAIDRQRRDRPQLKEYRAGCDWGSSQDVVERFWVFWSTILMQDDKVVEDSSSTMDTTGEIEAQQNEIRQMVAEALAPYKPQTSSTGDPRYLGDGS